MSNDKIVVDSYRYEILASQTLLNYLREIVPNWDNMFNPMGFSWSATPHEIDNFVLAAVKKHAVKECFVIKFTNTRRDERGRIFVGNGAVRYFN